MGGPKDEFDSKDGRCPYSIICSRKLIFVVFSNGIFYVFDNKYFMLLYICYIVFVTLAKNYYSSMVRSHALGPVTNYDIGSAKRGRAGQDGCLQDLIGV